MKILESNKKFGKSKNQLTSNEKKSIISDGLSNAIVGHAGKGPGILGGRVDDGQHDDANIFVRSHVLGRIAGSGLGLCLHVVVGIADAFPANGGLADERVGVHGALKHGRLALADENFWADVKDPEISRCKDRCQFLSLHF